MYLYCSYHRHLSKATFKVIVGQLIILSFWIQYYITFIFSFITIPNIDSFRYFLTVIIGSACLQENHILPVSLTTMNTDEEILDGASHQEMESDDELTDLEEQKKMVT